MRVLGSSKKWVLVAIGLLLALFVLKITLLLIAKPKIAVDYVAEYNKITRPANYDPNDNAAPYYQKAFDAFVAMPIELRKPYVNWPTDFNKTEQVLFEKWLTLNAESFKYFKIAINKPYYWIERKGKEDNNMMGLMFPELSSLRQLTEALMWNAKLTASEGQPQMAFENIIDCYKAGRQKCRTPSCLTEQLVGIGVKKTTVGNALIILDEKQVNGSSLKSFQDALQEEFGNDTYVPDFTAEKLSLYDAVQITFIENGKGNGRLAWRVAYYYDTLCGVWANRARRLNCFIGPTKNQTIQQIEKVFTISNQIMAKNPWQIKSEGHDYFEEIEKIHNSNFLLQILGVNTESIFHSYHKTKAQTEALIAVLAILRFKANKGQFPASLDELISTGYLKSVPMDPYSDGPLVYKPNMDNFKLYSVGEDFSDDGGLAVFTSSHPSGLRGDIIFWPVRQFEHHRKEFENRKIEKEAESQEKIEEAK